MANRNLHASITRAARYLWKHATLATVNQFDNAPLVMNAEYLRGVNAAGTGTVDLIGPTAGDAVAIPSALSLAGDVTMAAAKAIALSAAGFTMAAIARTATADGTGTGTIASGPMLQFVTVTAGGDANAIIVLPAPTPGTIVVLHVAATGYELRTSAPATIGINGGTGASAESAIGANTTVVMICATATSWKGLQLGSDGTLAKVEVAA